MDDMSEQNSSAIESFLFEDDDISFSADPGDMRSCTIFLDEHTDLWCAGVTVRDNYSKIRFGSRNNARAFAKAFHKAKTQELVRRDTKK